MPLNVRLLVATWAEMTENLSKTILVYVLIQNTTNMFLSP
jgi:hypothetical protein